MKSQQEAKMSQEENCFVVPVPPRGVTAVRINPNKK